MSDGGSPEIKDYHFCTAGWSSGSSSVSWAEGRRFESCPATNSFISLSLKINRGLNGGFLLNINYRSDAVVVELEDTLVLEASA